MTTLIIGGGFAGVAAAWALTTRSRQVHLIWEREGASSLYSGALDRSDWLGPPDPRPLTSDVEAFLAALGAFAPPAPVPARLATTAGMVRAARCHDRALLDLEPLRGRRIDVVDFGRPGWDASQLARAFGASSWARLTRTEFQPLTVAPPDAAAVRLLGASELAARADDPEWAAQLGAALRGAGNGETPLLVGPWLGLEPSSVERLRELVRRPLGETLSEPGGAAGLRFEAARAALLERARVKVTRGEVRALRRAPGGFEASGRFGDESGAALDELYPEVVIAVGGVVGGGVRFLEGSGARGRSFSLSVDAGLELRLGGREVTLTSEVAGLDLQRLGMEALSDVGVLADEQQLAAPDLYAVGDVVADRPRTALEAICAGIAAARAVCRPRTSSSP